MAILMCSTLQAGAVFLLLLLLLLLYPRAAGHCLTTV
jgi:hypothetical protein